MHKIANRARLPEIAILLAGIVPGQGALASSASTSVAGGTVGAQITAPLTLSAVNSMQFGSFVQPTASGTVVMTPQGTITTTGGMAGLTAIAQPVARGAAGFKVTGAAGMNFILTGVAQVTLAKGAARMTLGQFTTDSFLSAGTVGTSGTYTFNIGGTLSVTAGQATGTYTGTFPITVTYY